jgi:hypothetical protein
MKSRYDVRGKNRKLLRMEMEQKRDETQQKYDEYTDNVLWGKFGGLARALSFET